MSGTGSKKKKTGTSGTGKKATLKKKSVEAPEPETKEDEVILVTTTKKDFQARKKKAKSAGAPYDEMYSYFLVYYKEPTNIEALANAKQTSEKSAKKFSGRKFTYDGVETEDDEFEWITVTEIQYPYTPEYVEQKLESRLKQVESAAAADGATMLQGFDQIVECFGDGSLPDRVPGAALLPHVFQLGGVCGTVCRHWVDYMANPGRPDNPETFRDIFTAFFALDEDEKGITNYNGKKVKSGGGMMGMTAKRLAPCFTLLTEEPYKGENRIGPILRGKKKGVTTFLDTFLPNDEESTVGRYMIIQVVHGGSGHVLAIAKPAANRNEYHMFDPNIGHFKGTQKGCNSWLRAQFTDTYTPRAGWGATYQITLEYNPELALTKKGKTKHYVHYDTR